MNTSAHTDTRSRRWQDRHKPRVPQVCTAQWPRQVAPKSYALAQGGFTLVEMMFAVALASILIMAMQQATAPAMAFMGKRDTQSQLSDMRAALEQAYIDHAQTIDAQTGAVFTTAQGPINPVLPNTERRCDPPITTFNPIARYLPSSAAAVARDGHGQGVCVFITERIAALHAGVAFDYHAIAVISAGFDGAIDTGTTLSTDGVLSLGGDDKGIVVDGRLIVSEQITQAQAQIDRVGQALSDYFYTRYQSNASRDMAVYYFANRNRANAVAGSFDSTGLIANTRGTSRAITDYGNHTQLGLSVSDVTDPWGNVLLFDNSSDAVRNPDASAAGMRSPPYTARVRTQMPNGSWLERTVVGIY